MTSLTTYRTLALAAVMAANFMIAIEATIVSTAMPHIVAQLGGLPFYSWVFAAFLAHPDRDHRGVRQAVRFTGRRGSDAGRDRDLPLRLAALRVARSMPSLIVFRLVQGVGAGAVQPSAMTIVGDLYPAHERGETGLAGQRLGAVGGAGASAGGLIIQYFCWAWIFWMNLPIGVFAAAGFGSICTKSGSGRRQDRPFERRHLHRRHRRRHGRSDGVFDLGPAGDRTHHPGGCGRGRAVRAAGAPLAGADDLARSLGTPADRRGERGLAATGMVMIGLTTFLPPSCRA